MLRLAVHASIDAATAAQSVGIETYVISVGNDVGDAHLADMAAAGKGGVVSPFYKALNPDQLVSAFDDIIGGVRSCEFNINGRVDPATAEGVVILNGSPLEQNVDWRVSSGTTLELLGAADAGARPGPKSLATSNQLYLTQLR